MTVSTVPVMNDEHLELLASDDWRSLLRDQAFPFTFADITVADLGDDVLEVGPGPGLATDLLTENLPTLTAVELDPELAAALGARVDPDRVTVIHGDAADLPFDDGRFSGAASFTMFHHVPTVDAQDQVLAEVARVLRPGGLFVANDSVASDDLARLHHDDTYNPVDPGTLPARLARVGLIDIEVRTNPFAWAARARRPA